MAEPAVAASMAAHATDVKAKQSEARRRGAPKVDAKPTKKPDERLAALVTWRKSADAPTEVIEVIDAAIRRGTATPRTTMAKASPSDVAAFFKSTGLSMKEIAEAVGVSTSVISTVTRENGDRWSAERFERAKPLILAAAKKAKPKAS
jgi:hypothetical protein